jgi:hypothetical protein
MWSSVQKESPTLQFTLMGWILGSSRMLAR